MDDHDEHSSASNPLRARMRDTLAGVRRTAVEATDRLKSTAAAERLGSSVDSWRVVKKAASAQRRGNHAMAYRLLEPEVRANPDDARLVAAYWSAALACERIPDAVPAMQRIVRTLAIGGKVEQAAELWLELHSVAPDARIGPGTLVRIVPVLAETAEAEQVVVALREAVHPENSGLSPGLAVRVAELALERDPRTALSAAHRALASTDLDAAKRARLEDLVAELERSEAEAVAGAPAAEPVIAQPVAAEPEVAEPVVAEPEVGEPDIEEPAVAEPEATEPRSDPVVAADTAATQAAVAAALEAPTPVTRFVDIKVTEAMPTRLEEEGIRLQLCGGRKARVAYTGITALAVVRVSGLGDQPIVVIDLVLNWQESEETTLRVVRLRSDGFDPRMVVATGAENDVTLCDFLAELIASSEALSLPDANAALGVRLRAFDDLETYEREVLQVKR
ncbi:MAG: hypothetical protein JRG90_09380 [Deltaproteobacteria bacterium]|nr:hypothetical protein [Deltaproteobacteria bacterium]